MLLPTISSNSSAALRQKVNAAQAVKIKDGVHRAVPNHRKHITKAKDNMTKARDDVWRLIAVVLTTKVVIVPLNLFQMYG